MFSASNKTLSYIDMNIHRQWVRAEAQCKHGAYSNTEGEIQSSVAEEDIRPHYEKLIIPER